MWDMVDDSIYSRFPEVGKGIAASFPRYKGDYIEYLYNLAKEIAKTCKLENKKNYFYHSFGSTWEINPTKTKEMFDRKYEINPEDARCKFECIPPMAIDAFYKDTQRVDNCKVYRTHPIDALGRWKSNFIGNQEFIYYARFDLSKNHDSTGFAMVHVAEYDNDDKPIVDTDVARRYIPRRGQDLNYASMRNDLLALTKKGFQIVCSFDQYQSLDFAQILEQEGIRTSRFSVDRTIEPHQTAKNLVYDKRVKLYIDKNLQKDMRGKDDPSMLIHELKTLRLIEGKKVDHPPNGSKDIADAWAGAIFDALKHPSGGVGVEGI
jgi:hypothetical protein